MAHLAGATRRDVSELTASQRGRFHPFIHPLPSYAGSTAAAARGSCSGVGTVVATVVLIQPLHFVRSLLVLPFFFVCSEEPVWEDILPGSGNRSYPTFGEITSRVSPSRNDTLAELVIVRGPAGSHSLYDLRLMF